MGHSARVQRSTSGKGNRYTLSEIDKLKDPVWWLLPGLIHLKLSILSRGESAQKGLQFDTPFTNK